ncbi:MAG TPA: RNA-binding protein [Candidatus Latescibacteria bacterium]|jgi:RNA recognition motif-containing protein|nr:RNA-binding protein [Candidatus Latescibacterota bacterium]
MKIRIDDLAGDVTEDELRTLFELFGAVAAVSIDTRRRWGQIDMPSKAAAREAIEGLNGQNLKGFDMKVAEMADRPPSRPKGKPRRGRRR